ncbi:MAG: FAD:protein FMN transferase [Firmicutes bacterium]|nr:FAD:protein FMN transferase [Bacillota bacterium]
MKKYAMIICGLLVCMIFVSCASGDDSEAQQENADIQTYRYTGFAMGTAVMETIYSSGADPTTDVESCLKEVEEKWISWKSEGSEIAALNKNAGKKAQTVSDATADCLSRVLAIAKDSRGAFDPTIGQLTRLWDLDNGSQVVPEEKKIKELLKSVGYEGISVEGNKVSLETGTSIDLGAAGKGMGCDEVKKLLSQDPDISGAVITIGGSSIMTYGSKPDGSPWSVALTDPRDTADYLGTLTVTGEQYISTSGDYEKFFMKDGIRYHHILDPGTGSPSRSGLISTTIICDKGLESDALATACFVLGKEKGMALAEAYDAEAVFVDEDKQVYMTKGASELFELTNEGYQYSQPQ